MASSTARAPVRVDNNAFRGFWREVSRNRLAYVFLIPVFVVLAFVNLLPMLQGVHMSLYQFNLFRPGARPFVGLGQYQDLVQDPLFAKAFVNTWYYTVGSVVCQFVLGLVAAVLLNQKVRFQGLFRGIVLIPWVVPGSLAAMMFGLLFTSAGLVNSLLNAVGFTQLGIIGPDHA